jgi:hypothetical protein
MFPCKNNFTTRIAARIPRVSIYALALVILGSVAPLRAQQPRFQLLKTYVRLPEMQPQASFTLLTDDQQITFIPPRDSVVQIREIGVVQFSYKDDRCVMKLRLSTNNPALASPDSWEQLRGEVQARYPDAEVSAPAMFHAGCQPGCVFMIQQPTPLQTKLVTRLAFVPFQGGMLEMSVSAAAPKFEDQQPFFNCFVASVTVEKPDPSTLAIRTD